jgi:hypothetical protein
MLPNDPWCRKVVVGWAGDARAVVARLMRSRASSDSERSGKERSAPRPGDKFRKSQCPSTFTMSGHCTWDFSFQREGGREREAESERQRARGREGERARERERGGERSKEMTTVAS